MDRQFIIKAMLTDVQGVMCIYLNTFSPNSCYIPKLFIPKYQSFQWTIALKQSGREIPCIVAYRKKNARKRLARQNAYWYHRNDDDDEEDSNANVAITTNTTATTSTTTSNDTTILISVMIILLIMMKMMMMMIIIITIIIIIITITRVIMS